MSDLQYVIIGAGGTGGGIGTYMAEAGKHVTLIARGAHLEALKTQGLRLETTTGEPARTIPVRAFSMETYPENEHPDVIFVCVKSYSLDSVYPFISRIAKPETVVIPILNIYGTGGRMQEKLPGLLVTDGCIYIAAEIKEPGVILKKGDILRVVYGPREPEEMRPVLKTVQQDLADSGIDGVLSDNIRRSSATCRRRRPADSTTMCRPARCKKKEKSARRLRFSSMRSIISLMHSRSDLNATSCKGTSIYSIICLRRPRHRCSGTSGPESSRRSMVSFSRSSARRTASASTCRHTEGSARR
jgi:hypothetical protein